MFIVIQYLSVILYGLQEIKQVFSYYLVSSQLIIQYHQGYFLDMKQEKREPIQLSSCPV